MKAGMILMIAATLAGNGSFAQHRQLQSERHGSFTVVADSFNSEFRLWYKLRLVIKRDTFSIAGLAPENGSELHIRPSANGRYFVIDNIIKGYEETDGQQALRENYKCVIVDVRNQLVVHEMQSACGGKWSAAGKWIDNGFIVFDPLKK